MPNKEVYEYSAPWQIYASNWSARADQPFRLALGSFVEEYCNKIQVVQLNEQSQELEELCTFSHPYPATKVQWHPSANTNNPDLIATSGDYLRLWEVQDSDSVKMKCMLTTNKHSEFCAPLTAFDWCGLDPSRIGTASIDTTCTIWDVVKEEIRAQLLAHDKEVYDIAFSPKNPDHFTSVGADGSMRMFDLRALEHSTVVYESNQLTPLLRLSWNKMDENYIAALPIESNDVVIIDRRYPNVPAAVLSGHKAVANALVWAPHSSCHICTAGDDWQALIWDLQSLPEPVDEPILAYTAEGEVNQLQWSALQSDWVSICFNDRLQALRV